MAQGDDRGIATAQSFFVKAAAAKKSDQPTNSNNAGTSDSAPTSGNKLANPMYASACPVVGRESDETRSPVFSERQGGGCPVVGGGVSQAINPGNQMPSSPNAPLPGQSKPLSTWRQRSSIPSTDSESSGTQNEPQTWTYPSEQMFYNAMKRKGWSPSEDDMTAVVAIHNAVNERAWREIQRWEAEAGLSHACGGPRLIRFKGRPQDYSPKARLLNLLGYKLPFDRHDWIVDRCGTEVRYIIDFYNAAPYPDAPAALHLDVRPALDSPSALLERLAMQFKWMTSGRWYREQ